MQYIPKEIRISFRQLCTTATGYFDERKYSWMIEDYSRTNETDEEFSEIQKVSPTEYPKADLKSQQKSAMAYMINNFSKEERLLIMFAQDSEKLLSCFAADKFKSESARQMIIGELSETFLFLKKKMIEFRWNKKFLAEKGIDFIQLRNLYFQLCVS